METFLFAFGDNRSFFEMKTCYPVKNSGNLLLSKVNNRATTIAAIEANNDTYCVQKRIEKFPLDLNVEVILISELLISEIRSTSTKFCLKLFLFLNSIIQIL